MCCSKVSQWRLVLPMHWTRGALEQLLQAQQSQIALCPLRNRDVIENDRPSYLVASVTCCQCGSPLSLAEIEYESL